MILSCRALIGPQDIIFAIVNTGPFNRNLAGIGTDIEMQTAHIYASSLYYMIATETP